RHLMDQIVRIKFLPYLPTTVLLTNIFNRSYTRRYSSVNSSWLMTRCPTVPRCTADNTTCSLSVMITARVHLPYVASTHLLLSLATVMIRVIGADSGDTIDMTRFAETTFPNPILINCKPKMCPPRFASQ